MVLLILLIHPLLLSTRQGQHLNAYTRGETGRQIVVGMGGKRKWFCIWTPDLLSSLAFIPPPQRPQVFGRTNSEGMWGWEERSHISKKVEARVFKNQKTFYKN